MAEELDPVAYREGLARRVDASLVGAGDALRLASLELEDAPVRRAYHVDGLAEGVAEGHEVAVHARLEVVVRLDDGYVVTRREVEAAIARGAVALVVLVDDVDARVLRREGVRDGR